MSDDDWTDDVEEILSKVRQNCIDMYKYHLCRYFQYKRILPIFRVPVLILNALNSVFSVGLQPYMEQSLISVLNCLISLIATLINSIEMYMGIQKSMESEMSSSQGFYILSIGIYKMLTLKRENRDVNGKQYLMECYNTYSELVRNSKLIKDPYMLQKDFLQNVNHAVGVTAEVGNDYLSHELDAAADPSLQEVAWKMLTEAGGGEPSLERSANIPTLPAPSSLVERTRNPKQVNDVENNGSPRLLSNARTPPTAGSTFSVFGTTDVSKGLKHTHFPSMEVSYPTHLSPPQPSSHAPHPPHPPHAPHAPHAPYPHPLHHSLPASTSSSAAVDWGLPPPKPRTSWTASSSSAVPPYDPLNELSRKSLFGGPPKRSAFLEMAGVDLGELPVEKEHAPIMFEESTPPLFGSFKQLFTPKAMGGASVTSSPETSHHSHRHMHDPIPQPIYLSLSRPPTPPLLPPLLPETSVPSSASSATKETPRPDKSSRDAE